MSRWHERSCKLPDVAIDSGMPFCRYCYALPSQEEGGSSSPLDSISIPRLANRAQMDLNWPAAVRYNDISLLPGSELESSRESIDDRADATTGNPSKKRKTEQNPTIFPDIDLKKKEIRLLRLEAGGQDDPIHADFRSADLGSSSIPTYDVLSYGMVNESGDSEDVSPIYIGPYWDMIYVGYSCYQAIRRHRSKQASRLVWVDCACIQVQDVSERNHQVNMMHEICTSASKVVAYLGEESEDSGMALDFIRGAVTKFLVSGDVAIPDEAHKQALSALFARPYFSRLWVIQEIILSKDLEIACGRQSVLWPNFSLTNVIPDLPAPDWMLERMEWRKRYTGKLTSTLLLYASEYRCSDPRDKIFGILGLVSEQGVSADYRLSVETVYTGIAAHLIKNHHAFDILTYAAPRETTYSLPSWTPDWSQKLEADFSKTASFEEGESVAEAADVAFVSPFAFEMEAESSKSAIEIDRYTGALKIYGTKLFDLSGRKIRAHQRTIIVMDKGMRGIFIISVPNPEYEIGLDSVFLLNGWHTPVILRSQPGKDSYLFTSSCRIEVGYSGQFRFPWDESTEFPGDPICISEFSLEEKNQIRELYSTLAEVCGTSVVSSDNVSSELRPEIRATVLDYSFLSLTALRHIESVLIGRWEKLEEKLGWMFRDQAALCTFYNSVGQEQMGHCKVKLEPHEFARFERECGLEFDDTVDWDLRRFVSSFIESMSASTDGWTPIVSQLKKNVSDIQEWAKTTEELLKVFKYSNLVLGRTPLSLPGSELPDKWLHCWKEFSNGEGEIQAEQVKGKNQWDWSIFKNSLHSRARVWEISIPPPLNPATNHKMAIHIGLRAVGMDFGSAQLISIL